MGPTVSCCAVLGWAAGTYDLRICCNGVLSGLVMVTSMCGYIDPWAAVVCGAIAGAAYPCMSFALVGIMCTVSVAGQPLLAAAQHFPPSYSVLSVNCGLYEERSVGLALLCCADPAIVPRCFPALFPAALLSCSCGSASTTPWTRPLCTL
jgi:hypothetical protein